ncbi:hypothetical protein DM02DRAFT_731390 [Periconia macrospinosa]|uniref:Rhodopsin domain-containing protein n=1 Tax=Periconia macrospinosa TaxID=97972 RepID=A0A2V1DDG3_9PLEO|nr:hypothetical protein DM02DRAFT_731390 [Periconia macrospinosa]
MVLIPSYNHVGVSAITVGAIASFLAITAAVLRVWARRITGSSLDSSDWTCFAGLVVSLTLFGSTINTVVQGLGLNINELSPKQIVEFSKGLLVGNFTWTASNTLVRISIILLYIRIFPNRKFYMICWIFIAENIVCWVANYIALFAICRPFAYNWDKTIPHGYCADQQRLFVWTGVQNLIHDIFTTIMPMPMLWGLKMPWARKISIMLMFAMGGGICVLTMIRTIETAKKAALLNVTGEFASVGILSILEPLLGVVNASLPLLRPVFLRLKECMGFPENSQVTKDSHPGYIQSIGSRRMRVKLNDPFPLDTIASVRGQSSNEPRSELVSDGESVKNLIMETRPTD